MTMISCDSFEPFSQAAFQSPSGPYKVGCTNFLGTKDLFFLIICFCSLCFTLFVLVNVSNTVLLHI